MPAVTVKAELVVSSLLVADSLHSPASINQSIEYLHYISTKFREYILLGAEICLKELETGPIQRWNSTFGSNFDNCHPSVIFLCIIYKISRKSLNAPLSYCDSTFSLHTFKPTSSTAQRYSAVMQAIYRLS